MARKYTDNLTALSKASQLFPGAVVYKHLDDGGEPEKYQDDGLGDFVHVGLCVATSPLRIIHASSAAGKVTSDSKIGKWAYFGKLTGVDYSVLDEDETASTDESNTEEGEPMTGGKLITLKAMNIRDDSSTNGQKLGLVPAGKELDFEGDTNSNWVLITYNNITGYICTNPKRGYVKVLSTTTDEDDDVPVYTDEDGDGEEDSAQSTGEMESRVSELEEGSLSQTDINEDIVNILRTLCQREGIEWPGIRHMNTESIDSYEADE